jgi:ATP-dependent Clp protease ATP-binding subunit ClpA
VHYSPGIKTAISVEPLHHRPFFPDKALDLLDEAGAKVKLKRVADTQNLRKLETEINRSSRR